VYFTHVFPVESHHNSDSISSLTHSKNSLSAMAAFLHHCPFLKSASKPALRRTGTALLSLADRCPIIARQITVSSTLPKMNGPAAHEAHSKHMAVNPRRSFAQSASQVAVSMAKDCPFVASQIGVVRASSEVQEDVGLPQDSKPGIKTHCPDVIKRKIRMAARTFN